MLGLFVALVLLGLIFSFPLSRTLELSNSLELPLKLSLSNSLSQTLSNSLELSGDSHLSSIAQDDPTSVVDAVAKHKVKKFEDVRFEISGLCV
jgi:hypothetical protein